jgi:hypothetical protein
MMVIVRGTITIYIAPEGLNTRKVSGLFPRNRQCLINSSNFASNNNLNKINKDIKYLSYIFVFDMFLFFFSVFLDLREQLSEVRDSQDERVFLRLEHIHTLLEKPTNRKVGE